MANNGHFPNKEEPVFKPVSIHTSQLLRGALLALVAAPGALSLMAGGPEDAALASLMAMRADLGLDQNHGFRLRGTQKDELGQSHIRFQQTYKGLNVFGGTAIAHLAQGKHSRPLTYALKQDIDLTVTPSLQYSEALAIAYADLNPKGPFAFAPTVDLVVLPIERTRVKASRSAVPKDRLNAEDLLREVQAYHLAFHIHTELENGAEETAHTDYMIDAHSGAILKKWDTLQTTNVVGTGNSEYSITVNLNTNWNGSAYELYDTVRGMTFKTYDLNHSTPGSTDPFTGTLYSNSTTIWGDGGNYAGGSTSSANGQTAAVDAHYGAAKTYDYYLNVYGRNGIDGLGTPTYNRVHYGTGFDNAFWSGSRFCMTYGDGGTRFRVLTALDVAGHEMSHGVCDATAGLIYSDESGGLNESNSDIQGNMVELFARSGGVLPSTTSSSNTCWTVGEQVMLAAPALRYMYKPSKDGGSPDAWYTGIGRLDVHKSSGPNNRMFFFLSQGASSVASSEFSSAYTPSSFPGIGPAKAARIWFRALTSYMTPSDFYTDARFSCLNAASALFGASSAEYEAVQNAYAAVNVGLSAQAVAVTVNPHTAAVSTGGIVQFTATVTGTTYTAVTWTVIEAGGGYVDYNGKYFAPSLPGTFHVQATSQADTSKFDQATVTVTSSSDFLFSEVESNDTLGTANIIPSGNGTISGTVSSMSDLDFFAVTVIPGHTLTATLSSGDDALAILDVSGFTLASVTGPGGSVSYANSGSTTVTVYVQVKGYKQCAGTLAPTTPNPAINPDPNPCLNIYGSYTVSIQR